MENNNVGKVIQVIGSTLDAQFAEDALPALYNALSLEVERPVKGFTQTPVPMKAGDALMFPPLTIHASAPQTSRTRQRYSVDFRVIRSPEETTKSYFDPFERKVTQRH